jgi:thiol:disulfide interchange protein DsbG
MASQYYYDAGLQVRWLLISVLRPEEGLKKAAAILEAKDPAAALREHESNYDEGGITPLAQASAESMATVRANEEIMKKLEAYGIPVVLFKDKSGGVHVTVGMPKLSALPDIFNLPEQKIDDPKLARFH